MPSIFKPELITQNERGDEVSYPLDLVRAGITLDRAVIVQEIADSNGALLDDGGRNNDVYTFRAAFLGSSYLGTTKVNFQTIEKGEEVFDYFRESGIEVVFTHPSRGAVRGRVKSISRLEEDDVDSLFLDFTFYEEGIRPESTLEVDVISETERGFGQTFLDEIGNISASINDRFGMEGADLLNLALDPDIPIFNQVQDFSSNVRAFAKDLDSEIASLEGLFTAIENPANSFIATATFLNDIPGRIIGTISRTTERYKEAFNDLLEFPSRFASSLSNSLNELKAAFTGGETEKQVSSLSAQTLSIGISTAYSIDQDKRVSLKNSESIDPFDSDGNLIVEVQNPGEIETVDDIENSLTIARVNIQQSIDLNRNGIEEGEVQGLKITAEGLLFHVIRTKTELDKIVTIEVPRETPLHVILNNEEENYSAAERILSLNDIKKPSFVEGEVRIYER